MAKLIASIALASAVALSPLVASAHDYHGYGGGIGPGAAIGLGLLGAGIAAGVAGSAYPYGYYGAPAYPYYYAPPGSVYAYPPSYSYQPRYCWSGYQYYPC